MECAVSMLSLSWNNKCTKKRAASVQFNLIEKLILNNAETIHTFRFNQIKYKNPENFIRVVHWNQRIKELVEISRSFSPSPLILQIR